MIAFFCLFPVNIIYIGFWLVVVILSFATAEYIEYTQKVQAILFSVTGITAILLRIPLLIYSVRSFRDFGKGLKEVLQRADRHDLFRKRQTLSNPDDDEAEVEYVFEDDEMDVETVFANTYIGGGGTDTPYSLHPNQ